MILDKIKQFFSWLKVYFVQIPINPSLDCFKECYKIYMKYFVEQIDLLYKAEQMMMMNNDDSDKEYLEFYFEHLYKNMLYCKEKLGHLIDEQEPKTKNWINFKKLRPLYYEFMDYKKEYNFLFGASDSREETFKRAKIYMKKRNAEKDFE